MPKHSNVFYIYSQKESTFQAVEKATVYRNSYGLDLFQYDGGIFEGRTGAKVTTESKMADFASTLEANGGLVKFNELIGASIDRTGESPRYTRPDEKKLDVFPPDPSKADIVLSKDAWGGKRHYYRRFYNENGIELFNLKNETMEYRQVFFQCEGYMLVVGQQQQLDNIFVWLAELPNGVKGEVERLFSESLTKPNAWADIGFATILGRLDEAEVHNQPLREAQEQEENQRVARWAAEDAERAAEKAALKEEYEKALKMAEQAILAKREVKNVEIQGKSILMQLFRKHGIKVPLKTQGWIIGSLHDIYYLEDENQWSYRYHGNESTVFCDYLPLLIAAVESGT
jgi:hypothetical protein